MVDLFDRVKDLLGEVTIRQWIEWVVVGSWCYFYWAVTNYVTIAIWRGEFFLWLFGLWSFGGEVELMGWGQYFFLAMVTCAIISFPWFFFIVISVDDAVIRDTDRHDGEEDSWWVRLNDIGWIFNAGCMVGIFGFFFFALLWGVIKGLGYG